MSQEKTKTTTAIAVRDYLQKFGSGYPWQIWHYLHIELRQTKMRYTSFCSYFKTLEKLKLVIRSKPPKGEPPISKYQKRYGLKPNPRVWFMLNSSKLDSEEWAAPQRFLYCEIFRLTGKPRGRPAGSRSKPKT